MTYSPPKALPPNAVTWGLRFQQLNLGEGVTNMQSVGWVLGVQHSTVWEHDAPVQSQDCLGLGPFRS